MYVVILKPEFLTRRYGGPTFEKGLLFGHISELQTDCWRIAHTERTAECLSMKLRSENGHKSKNKPK